MVKRSSTTRDLLGYFKVLHQDGTDRLVVVSQECIIDDHQYLLSSQKIFTLDTVEGEEVMWIDDKGHFIRHDGESLKVVSHMIPSNSIFSQIARRRCLP